MTTLKLNHIYKSYRKKTIVKGVNLTLSTGEIVGLLGPNGAGKSTLFNIATGLIHPNSGQVYLDEQNITPLRINQRSKLGIGYLTQQPSIFRELTVKQNIELVLEQNSCSPTQKKRRLQELLSVFRLEHIADIKGFKVSGGERRRTELARALAVGKKGPDFLLLDEPFAGVDPISVAEIQTIITQLKNDDRGILITDHNVRETLFITDRAYIMAESEVIASGTESELYSDFKVKQYYLGNRFIA